MVLLDLRLSRLRQRVGDQFAANINSHIPDGRVFCCGSLRLNPVSDDVRSVEQEFRLNDCLEYVGTPEFERHLFEELGWSCDLDVSDLCQSGGWPKGEPTFSSLQISKVEDVVVTGWFKVGLTESTGDGCSHIATEKKRTGEMEFTLCRKTGRAVFKPRVWEQRECEPEEF